MEYQEVISKKKTKRGHTTSSFGNWECYDDDFPITQYFESAGHFFSTKANSDLFEAPPRYIVHQHKREEVDEKKKKKKQGKVWQQCSEATHHRQRPKAVDEDLYKIPPEFLSRKTKRGMVISDFWRRCFGLSCIP